LPVFSIQVLKNKDVAVLLRELNPAMKKTFCPSRGDQHQQLTL
jgi:hypothetical protein